MNIICIKLGQTSKHTVVKYNGNFRWISPDKMVSGGTHSKYLLCQRIESNTLEALNAIWKHHARQALVQAFKFAQLFVQCGSYMLLLTLLRI